MKSQVLKMLSLAAIKGSLIAAIDEEYDVLQQESTLVQCDIKQGE